MSTGHYGLAVPIALRSFPKLFCRSLTGKKMQFPDDLPAGFHVVLLLSKNKHHWEASTWTDMHEQVEALVRTAHIRNLKDQDGAGCSTCGGNRGSRNGVKRKSKRESGWGDSGAFVDTAENRLHPDRVFYSYLRKEKFYNKMGIINDNRPYCLMIKQDGEILYGNDGRFDVKKHDFEVRKVVKEEMKRQQDTLMLMAEEKKQLEGERRDRIPEKEEETKGPKIPEVKDEREEEKRRKYEGG